MANKPRYFSSSFWNGTLSAIAPLMIDGVETLSATLTKTVKGVEVKTPVTVASDKLDAVRDVFVEGPVSLYGKLVDGTFVVTGRDLRARTLAKAAAPATDAVAKPAPVAASAPVAAAPMAKARVFEGELSQVKPGKSDRSGEYVSAKFTHMVDGQPVVQSVLASGPALEKTRHLFVDGPVAFYAQQKDAKTLNVIGPDLRRKTLAAQAPAMAA